MTLIRLCGCAGLSESSLGAHALLQEMLCPGSYIIVLNVRTRPCILRKNQPGLCAIMEEPDQTAYNLDIQKHSCIF